MEFKWKAKFKEPIPSAGPQTPRQWSFAGMHASEQGKTAVPFSWWHAVSFYSAHRTEGAFRGGR